MRLLAHRSRGVALLAAVLVVALATILIAGLLDRSTLGQARSLQMTRAAQAFAFQQGLELWAARILRDDQALGGGDHRGEIWAQPMPPIDLPEGRIFGHMRDLDGCLNLNALISTSAATASLARERLERLLGALDLDAGLADAITDWLDADDFSQGGGAGEIPAYASLSPPRRPGNGPFAHVSELRAVAGVDAERYDRLAPHVCARPDADGYVNVNTASPQVLRSLHENIGIALAQRLHRDGRASYVSAETFWDEVTDSGGVAIPVPPGEVATASRYFIAEAEILQAGVPVRVYSLLMRPQSGEIRVLARSQGRF